MSSLVMSGVSKEKPQENQKVGKEDEGDYKTGFKSIAPFIVFSAYLPPPFCNRWLTPVKTLPNILLLFEFDSSSSFPLQLCTLTNVQHGGFIFKVKT